MTQVLYLPYLPHPLLSPNGRGHWAARYHEAQKMKQDVKLLAQQLRPMGRAIVHITFVVPDRRRRDPDNWGASLKACFDGLVAAMFVGDDDSEHLRILPPVFVVDKTRAPATVMEFEEWRNT